MKLKTIVMGLFALMLLIPSGDIYGQTRKKTTAAKKTTTAAKKTGTSSSASAVKPLTLAQVDDHLYYGLMLFDDLKKVGKDVGFYTSLALYPNDLTWNLLGDKMDGSYSVTSNTLKVVSGGIGMNLTSTNGGKTLKGKFYNDKGVTCPMEYYQVKNGELNSEVCETSIAKGTFKAFIEVYMGNGSVLFPVEFKATPNEDGTGGTYKISVDNALGLGLIKGSYTITDTGMLFTSNLEGCSTEENRFRKVQDIFFKLGKKHIDGSGKCPVYLRLFNQ